MLPYAQAALGLEPEQKHQQRLFFERNGAEEIGHRGYLFYAARQFCGSISLRRVNNAGNAQILLGHYKIKELQEINFSESAYIERDKGFVGVFGLALWPDGFQLADGFGGIITLAPDDVDAFARMPAQLGLQF